MTSTDTDRLAEARARIDAAGDHLGEICTSKKQFRMSIPADPSKDSDLILGAALESAEDLLSLVEQLQGQLDEARDVCVTRHGEIQTLIEQIHDCPSDFHQGSLGDEMSVRFNREGAEDA